MSEEALERTPESGGLKAIEDAGPSDGVMRPSGPPVVLGPAAVNPFWSERFQDEAVLRALRPADLPVESPELLPDSALSPPKEGVEAFRTFLRGLMSENARLWTERESWAAGQGNHGWGNPSLAFNHPPPWVYGMMSEGQQREKNMMDSLLEALRSSWVSSGHGEQKGLLGPLSSGGDCGGRGAVHGLSGDQGGLHGHLGGPRASLMEVFNRVSATSGDVMQGMVEASKTLARHGFGGQWPEQPSLTQGCGKGYMSGGLQGGTVGGQPGAGQGLSNQPDQPDQSRGPSSSVPQESSSNGRGGQHPADRTSQEGSQRGGFAGTGGGGRHGGGHHGLGGHDRGLSSVGALGSGLGMKEARLDMGALGHQCRKPTTLGTNIPHLCSFEGLSDSRDHGQSIDPNASIEARVQQSRGWAAWLERFKEEIVKGILLVVDQQGDIDFPDGNPNVAKMTAEQWRSHVLQDHVPLSRECTTCLRPQRCHDFECRHLWTVSPGGRLSKKGKVLLGGSMPFQGHGGAT